MAYLRYALSICISLLILVFLFTKVPFEQIIAVIGHSRVDLFFLSVLVGAVSIIVNALRWKVLLRVLGYEYSLRFLSKLTFMTVFFNIYLPGGVMGDVARIAILPDERTSAEERRLHLTRITASVITDRVVGLAGLMILAFIGFIFYYRLLLNSKILAVFGIATFGVIAVFLLLFSRRVQLAVKKAFALPLRVLSPVKTVLKSVTEALFVYRDNYAVFNKVIPMGILGNLCVVCYFFLLARSIGVNIGFLKLLAFVPVIEFVAAMPISVGGAGIRETVTILLFSSERIPAAEAMSVSLLSFVILLLLGAAGGVFFLLWHIEKNKKRR